MMYRKPEPLLLLIGFAIGAVIGYVVVEQLWQFTHPGVFMGWNRPIRAWSYYAFSASTALSVGSVVVALLGFRHLSEGE